MSHASRSVAAVVHGMRTFDPSVRIVGVVLNKAGSPRHAQEVLDALAATDLPVLGVLRRDDGIVAPSRHLGLVPAAERPAATVTLDLLAERVEANVDLDQLLVLAREAPDLDAEPWSAPTEVSPRDGPRPLVAVAGGRAFTFRYTETEELLRAAGCDVVTFDPLTDEDLPAGISALYLGGGFPEVYAGELSVNHGLRAAVLDAVSSGLPTVAECAGLLYLCRSLDGRPMVGALAADAVMTPRLTLGYRTGVVTADQLTGPAGTRIRGHEFHRTSVSPAASSTPAYELDGSPAGFGSSTLSASYLHVHWAGYPALAARFADAARAFASSPATPALTHPVVPAVSTPSMPEADPLRHHGDRELTGDLADFAVNVYAGGPPGWLTEALADSLTRIGHYPNTADAESAIAATHGRSATEVLATAGAAEAFTLIARARPWRVPVVINPQFTEPEVALAAAGLSPTRLFCSSEEDFAIPAEDVPADADLVIIGNPTNPTGVLHPEAVLRRLLRPGRTVVVDEAFMETVPDEPGSLARVSMTGLVVVRSLTKLWGIPGVRAGYVLGDAALLADLRRQQPAWSVSTAAAAAMIATTTSQAAAERSARAAGIARDRAALTDGLDRLGIPHVPGNGSFVLARVRPGTHERLRHHGIAVRRCDTFPGLDDSWVRIAVRPAAPTHALLSVLARTEEQTR